MGDENQAIAQQLAIDVWHEQGRQRGLREGYEQAITHLQARAAELREAVDEGRATSGELSYAEMYDVCATFLSARLTEEGDDRMRRIPPEAERVRFEAHAAIQAIDAHLANARREQSHVAGCVRWLENLRQTRARQIEAGTWPPRPPEETTP